MPAPPDVDTLDQLFAPAARKGVTSNNYAAQSSSAPTVSASMDALSNRYRDQHKLDFGDKIADGFNDHVSEGVILDRSCDDALDVLLTKSRKKLQKASDAVTAVMVMGLFVSDSLGCSGQQAAQLEDRFKERLRQQSKSFFIGSLFGEDRANKKHKGPKMGAGLSRHRALLFKFMVDHLGTIETTLERDGKRNVAWNTIRLDGAVFVVDLMHDPGSLYETGSGKSNEYIRLLEPGASSKFQTTISVREELSGRVPRPPWHVEVNELDFGRGDRDRLGKGGFGDVFKGTWTGSSVAIKVVKDKDPSDYDVMDFILEIALLSRLNHPNVMRFWRGSVEFINGRRSLLMVTENIVRGGLSGLLHGHGGEPMKENLQLAQALWLSTGVARGMQYIHSCNVLHLDLKSPNVLVDNDWTPKLCDFGLAKISALEGEEGGLQTTLRGVSPIWAPPEMFDEQAEDMTERADVYSFGIVTFEILSRQLPFQEIDQRRLPKAKFDGVLPALPKNVPDDCGKLIAECCAHKPTARPTMRGVVAKLHELTDVRKINLGTVEMPAWPSKGQHQAASDAAASEAARESEARKSKLENEKRQLKKQLEEAREQRRRVTESHLGASSTKEELGMLLPADSGQGKGGPGQRAAASESKPVAQDGLSVQKGNVKDMDKAKGGCCVIV